MTRFRVVIHYEIALFEQLEVVALLRLCQRCFHFCRYHLQAVRIEQVTEVPFLRTWVLDGKQTVIQPHFGIDRTLALHPVDRCLGLPVTTFGARLTVRIIGRINGRDIALCILFTTRGLDDITALQTYLTSTGTQAIELVIWFS